MDGFWRGGLIWEPVDRAIYREASTLGRENPICKPKKKETKRGRPLSAPYREVSVLPHGPCEAAISMAL